MLTLLVAASVLAWHPQLIMQQPPARGPSCDHRRSAIVVAVETEQQQQRVAEAMEIKPVAETSARSVGLALALDDGTRKSHSLAENTAFVTGFFRGIAKKEAFAQLVTSLYFVYEAMERAFDETTDPAVKALDYSSLRRLASLEKDMAYFHGDGWRASVKPTAATAAYVQRIEEVARESPCLLVAHQYTRYLGDLFGGQMMGGMARRSLGLDPGRGTEFYTFDEVADAKSFIEEWYSSLNELDLTDDQRQAIVDEGNLVFTLNIGIFDELEGGKRAVVGAVWTLAKDAFKRALGLGPKRDAN